MNKLVEYYKVLNEIYRHYLITSMIILQYNDKYLFLFKFNCFNKNCFHSFNFALPDSRELNQNNVELKLKIVKITKR